MLNRLCKIPNHKHQIPNKFKYLIPKFKISSEKICFEHWDFDIWYYLLFGICSLEFINPLNIEQLGRNDDA